MKPSLRRVLLTQLLILVTAAPGVLLAANANDDDVIRNWSAPTYWQAPAAASNGNVSTKAGEAVSTVDAAPVPFVALSPCRLVDTRSDHGYPDPYGPPSLSPGITRDFQITGHCGVPAGATAVSFNFTVVRTLGLGFLATYPQGEAWPGSSTVNYIAGQQVANNAAISLGSTGELTVFVSNAQADLLIDINGYYGGSLVSTVNGLDGDVDIVPGSNVTITPQGNTLVIDAPLVVGPQGPQGATGATGAQGAAGAQGATGATGATGAAGAQGAVGPQGAQGVVGPQGAPGLSGAPGTPGAPGAQGDPGASMSFLGAWDSGTTYAALQAVSFNGSSYVSLANGNTDNSPDVSPLAWTLLAEKGATGATGGDGAQGPAGPTGATGAIGPQGPVGATGAVGPVGPTGATGAVGPQGAIGPQGLLGPVGPQGIPGQDGSQGIPGQQGVQGASLSFAGAWDSGTTYQTLQVVAFGGSGYISLVDDNLDNSPDASPLAWSLLAERGATGATGADGAQGAVGPVGPQGPVGATGATGAVGPQGPVGNTGATGAVGPQGPVGNTGATGAVGPQGNPGLPGAPGSTGAQGPIGPVGPQGVQGPAGSGGTMFSMKHDFNLNNSAGTRFFSPIHIDDQNTEDLDVVGMVAKACSMTALLARVDSLDSGITATLTLRTGATLAGMANTALTCNLTSAILSCTSSGAVALSAGDLFDIRLSYTAGDNGNDRVFLTSLSCD